MYGILVVLSDLTLGGPTAACALCRLGPKQSLDDTCIAPNSPAFDSSFAHHDDAVLKGLLPGNTPCRT